MSESPRSCLDLTEEHFQLLSRRPLTVDGQALSHGLPPRVTLTGLRVILLKRRLGSQVKDTVWSHLVHMARTAPDPWLMAAAGMMLPGLKSIAARISSPSWCDGHDLDSEILEGFLAALHRVDLGQPAPHTQLYFAAWRRGQRAAQREARHVLGQIALPESLTEHRAGNPDVALARAMRDGVVTPAQANLVSQVHLDSTRRGEAARQLGISRDKVRRELASATRGLSTYLRAA
jgi:DNA-directed RNA polymerase specialized sigma24 family protein